MGLNARNPYLSDHIETSNSASSQQQTEIVSPAATDLTIIRTPTVEELVKF